jgi:hypothetical protein
MKNNLPSLTEYDVENCRKININIMKLSSSEMNVFIEQKKQNKTTKDYNKKKNLIIGIPFRFT